jgi:signal peptidase I
VRKRLRFYTVKKKGAQASFFYRQIVYNHIKEQSLRQEAFPKGVYILDDKDLDRLDTDKDISKDVDYDLYELKYGIDLRPEPEQDGTASPEGEPSAPVSEKAKARHESNQLRMGLFDWLQCIVSAILCGILVFVFVGRIIGVEGSSMLNTLRDRDRIIMSNLLYTPRYGDIVVLKTDAYEDTPLVKRVIAVAGETLDIDFTTGDIMIDGKVIQEDYIRELTMSPEDFVGPITIPQGFVFVMGDNRNASTDSRSSLVGLVDTRQILGKVLFVLIPGPNDDGTRSWSRVGSVYK